MTTETNHALAALRRERLSALRDIQIERGLDAVLIVAQGGVLGAASRSHAYLRLFLDWDAGDQMSILVLSGRRATLLVTNPFQIPAASDVEGVDHVVFARPAEIGPALAALVGEAPAPSLGIVGLGEMQVQSWRSLEIALPGARYDDLSPVLDLWRGRKQAAEIAALERAANVCDILFERFGELLHEDRPAWRSQRDLELVAFGEGVEYCKTWLTVAPQADGPRYLRQECTRAPRAGDQVLLGLMLKRDGYWGHAIRMGSFREVRPEHLRLHGIALAMFEAGLPHFAIGRDLHAAELAMDNILEREFPGRGDILRFRNGLGLAYEEPGSVAAFPQHADRSAPALASALRLEAPAVFELHPNLFVPGLGGAALGDMVLATEGPPRRLLATPLSHRLWG